jgi:hypothetical protein
VPSQSQRSCMRWAIIEEYIVEGCLDHSGKLQSVSLGHFCYLLLLVVCPSLIHHWQALSRLPGAVAEVFSQCLRNVADSQKDKKNPDFVSYNQECSTYLCG